MQSSNPVQRNGFFNKPSLISVQDQTASPTTRIHNLTPPSPRMSFNVLRASLALHSSNLFAYFCLIFGLSDLIIFNFAILCTILHLFDPSIRLTVCSFCYVLFIGIYFQFIHDYRQNALIKYLHFRHIGNSDLFCVIYRIIPIFFQSFA